MAFILVQFVEFLDVTPRLMCVEKTDILQILMLIFRLFTSVRLLHKFLW